MSVLNRSMFQRPMPVVRRMAGSPKTGEEIYEDKGYDAYEYRADQDMDSPSLFDRIKNSKVVQGINNFLDKPTDQYGEGSAYELNEYEFGLLYPNVSFDSVTVEERTINTEGNDYRRLVELTTPSARATGSPPQGEKSDRFGEKRINEIMEIPLGDTGDLSKQFDRDEGVSQFIMEDFIKLEGPNWHTEGVLKLVQAFGNQDEIETMIAIRERLGSPERDEQQYEEDSKVRRALFEKYVDRIGGMDNYFKTHDRLNREFEMNEVYGTKFDPRMRNEGSPMQGELTPQESNMYYGDPGEQELHRELIKVANGQITNPQEIQSIITASIGEFGEGHVMAIIKEGGALMSSAEGQFSGMPHPREGMDGPYWNQINKRQQGSPMQGEQVNVENVGIMDGFSGDGSEAEAMAMVEEGERAKNEIDNTNTYDELMRSIRGDDLSEADRRQELASYVGEKDAEETPDSVLTLVQPVMQMLDEGTANTGIGQIEEGREMATIAPTQQDAEEMMAMNMPQQPVGVANGGYMSSFPNQNMETQSLTASDNIDDRIMQNLQFERMAPGMMGYANGGQVQHFATGDLAEIQNTYNERLPLYMDIINNPERSKGNTLMDASQAFLSYGMGADPKEALSYFLNKTGQRVDQQAKTEQAIQMGALNAAIGKFDAQELATLKMLSEKSKKNKTMVVGLTKERDEIIAKLLGLYKDAPTYGYQDPDLAGDEFSAGQVKDGKTQIIDYEKLYQLYPPGVELQFNSTFTEFLGKKGSSISYKGVDDKAEGGIVHREDGTPQEGEISEVSGGNVEDYEFGIFEVPVITGTSERDDITKLLLGSKKALYELAEMKQYILDDPSVGGVPGLILEKLRGIFTIFDQFDNAYLDNKYIKSDSSAYKFFDKPQITSIMNSKKRISKALADLTSFKGARQATAGQIEKTEEQIDPVGGFGATVSLEKIDEVGDEMVGLLKELLLGLGGLDPQFKQSEEAIIEQEGVLAKDSILRADLDPDWVNLQWSRLDKYKDDLINMTPSENSVQKTKDELEKLKNKKVLTIQQYEDLFGSIASRANESQ